MSQVTLIGAGNMGAPMAANLVRAGFNVTVYDADRSRAAEVARSAGARAAATLADAADCEFCVTMLPTSAIVQDVLLRVDGGAFIGSVRPGTIVIDMSSSEPAQTRETGRILADRGVLMVDAPVSGGVARAQSATLTIMIGSDDDEAVARATPVLNAMGNRLFRVGRLGAGDAMKAANNYVAAATYAATAEALVMGKAFGLDPAMMVEILNVSTGRSFNSEIVMKEHVVTKRYATGFALALLAKDVRIAAGLADGQGIDAPLSRLVSERYLQASGALGPGADNSEALRAWYAQIWEGE